MSLSSKAVGGLSSAVVMHAWHFKDLSIMSLSFRQKASEKPS